MSAPAPTPANQNGSSQMTRDEAQVNDLIDEVIKLRGIIEQDKDTIRNDVIALNNCKGLSDAVNGLYHNVDVYDRKMDDLIDLNKKLKENLELMNAKIAGYSQGTATGTPGTTTGGGILDFLKKSGATLLEGFLNGFENLGDMCYFITGNDDKVKERWAHDTVNSLTNTYDNSAWGSFLRWTGRAASLGLTGTLTAAGLCALAGTTIAAAPIAIPIVGAGLAAFASGYGASVEKSLNAGYDHASANKRAWLAGLRNAGTLALTMLTPIGGYVGLGVDAAMNGLPATPPGSSSVQPSGNSSGSQPEPEPNPSDETGGDSYQPDPGEDNSNGGGSGWDSSSDSGNYDDYTPTPDTGTTAVTETELASREGLIPVQPTDEAKIEELKPTDNTETTTTDQQNTNGENVITTEQSTNQPANTGENVTTIQDNPGETVVTETRYVQPEGNYQGYSYNENEGVSAPELETTPELDPNAIEDETELLTDIGELEDTTASFEDVIQANEYVKIPTSTTPIQTNPTSSGGNAFIPIAAGLSAAAAAGIGAKAYMDRKHNNDNGEEDDDFSEEWSDDYSDDNSITINENSADNQSESLLEDDYTYTEPEKYGARNNEELADLQ